MSIVANITVVLNQNDIIHIFFSIDLLTIKASNVNPLLYYTFVLYIRASKRKFIQIIFLLLEI